MYKLCVALFAVLAVVAAKPSWPVYSEPLAYSAYSAPVYSAPSVYSAVAPAPSVYSAVAPAVSYGYGAPVVAAPVAAVPAYGYSAYSSPLYNDFDTPFLYKKK